MGKSIGPKRNEAARAFTRRLIAERYGGHQTKAAEAFGVEQGSLSTFLSGRVGAGVQLLHGIARAAGVSVEVVIGEEKAPPRPALSALDIAVMFLRERVSDEAIKRAQEQCADRDTSGWLPTAWGLVLTRAQREIDAEMGLELPPEPGASTPAQRRPEESGLVPIRAEPKKHTA